MYKATRELINDPAQVAGEVVSDGIQEVIEEQKVALDDFVAAIVNKAVSKHVEKCGSWTVCNLGSGELDEEVGAAFSLKLSSVVQPKEDENFKLKFQFAGDIVDEMVELGCLPEIAFGVECLAGDYETLDKRTGLDGIYGCRLTDLGYTNRDGAYLQMLVGLNGLLAKYYDFLLLK